MRVDAARQRATYEDVLNAPDSVIAEILDGELIFSPRPAVRHAQTTSTLTGELHGPFQRGIGGPGGWWILDEPEIHLGEDVLVPDLAGWRRETLTALPDAAFIVVRPDWVCEVLSASTAGLDRVRKLRAYARERVGHAWLIDPAARTLEVFRRHEGTWLVVATCGENERVRVEPFEAVEIDLASLWIPSESGAKRE